MNADELRDTIAHDQPRVVEELKTLVRIPSIAFPGYDDKPVRASAETTADILEGAGFVTTQKIGRVRTCRLGRRKMAEEAAWIERYRQLWAARFDALDEIVEELKRQEITNERDTK